MEARRPDYHRARGPVNGSAGCYRLCVHRLIPALYRNVWKLERRCVDYVPSLSRDSQAVISGRPENLRQPSKGWPLHEALFSNLTICSHSSACTSTPVALDFLQPIPGLEATASRLDFGLSVGPIEARVRVNSRGEKICRTSDTRKLPASTKLLTCSIGAAKQLVSSPVAQTSSSRPANGGVK